MNLGVDLISSALQAKESLFKACTLSWHTFFSFEIFDLHSVSVPRKAINQPADGLLLITLHYYTAVVNIKVPNAVLVLTFELQQH